MRTRQRPVDERFPRIDGGPDCGPVAGALAEARRRGDDLLAAGDDVINKTLSRSSEGFLAQSKQEGGE